MPIGHWLGDPRLDISNAKRGGFHDPASEFNRSLPCMLPGGEPGAPDRPMTKDSFDAARRRNQELYAAAQDAKSRGENAQAYALFEELLPLLEPTGELQSKHVVLAAMAELLVQARDYTAALELWSQAVPLAEGHGDVHGASLILDKMAHLHASQHAWRRAHERWEQALALDTRLGYPHNRAATLGNLGLAAAQLNDKLKADRCWNEALTWFESANDAAAAVRIVKAMQEVAIKTGDWSDPLELRARAFRLAEAAHDARGQVLALDGLAFAAVQLDKYAQALAYLERAWPLTEALGDPGLSSILQEKIAQCRADLRGEKRTPHFASPPRCYASVSEFDVPLEAAGYFLVGELWAGLHAKSMPLSGLEVGSVTIGPAGIARLSANVRLVSGAPFDPQSAAADLSVALERYTPESATALLAGYARYGYEVLDRDQPGFTDALLDRFGVPEPRPRPMRVVNIEALSAALGVQLHAEQGDISLVLRETTGPSLVWQTSPELAFSFALALLVAGVDCRALWDRDAAATYPSFELLLPRTEVASELEPDSPRPPPVVSPGLGLAAALAYALRTMAGEEPFDTNRVLPWARKVLTEGHDARAMELGDLLIDVALHCAALSGPATSTAAASYLQRAVIFLEYTGRGERSDETRLAAVLRALGPQLYPSPLGRWSTQGGHWLGLWNSLLLTLRALATKAVAAQERGQVAVLRSAALRGVCTARHVLRLTYAATMSRDPEEAAHGLPLLRLTIKNYCWLLQSFLRSVQLEHEITGHSAWLPWLESKTGPTHFARELNWILALFDAAAQEGFSLDVARTFLRAGAEFYSEENSFFVLPGLASMRPAAN